MEQIGTIKKPEPTTIFRWTALVFLSLAMFGNYFVYDMLPPVNDLLVKYLHFSQSQIGMLRTLYSVPNIFMVLLGGILIDKIGVKKAAIIFVSLSLFGVILSLNANFDIMATGWFFFGLGTESLIVAITTSLVKWFKGKELAFAFGINLTIARLGSFGAENSPTWAHSLFNYWQDPLYLSLIAGIISAVAIVVYYYLDTKADKIFTMKKADDTDKVVFRDIFNFKASYWYIVLLCVTFYSAIFPFQTFAVKLFQDVDGVSRATGGFLNSMPIFFAMILTPIFGLLADKIGKRATLMMVGSVLLMPIYLVLVYTNVSPYIPMAVLGIAFSLVPAVLWPSVALVVPESKLGTAYGLMTMIQNIGLAGFNFLIGWVNDFSGDYVIGMWIFSTLGFFGFFFAYMLRKNEKKPVNFGLELVNKKN